MPKGAKKWQPDRSHHNASNGTRLSDDVLMMVHVGTKEYTLRVGAFENDVPYATVSTNHRGPQNLTMHTLAEVEALEELYRIAFVIAKRVAGAMDEQARKDYEDGISVDQRIYRQPPLVAARSRALKKYGESVRVGPWKLASLDGGQLPDPLGLAGNGASRKVIPDVVPRFLETPHDLEEDLGVQVLFEDEQRPGQFPGPLQGPTSSEGDASPA